MNTKQIIEKSIEEFNKSQNKFQIINKNDFELIGENSPLDSLAIVNFLTILENKIFEEINIKKDVVNEVFNSKKEKLYIKDLFLILDS